MWKQSDNCLSTFALPPVEGDDVQPGGKSESFSTARSASAFAARIASAVVVEVAARVAGGLVPADFALPPEEHDVAIPSNMTTAKEPDTTRPGTKHFITHLP